jgi:hypothetical protein
VGGGNFVLMKDLSSPINVRGRHWARSASGSGSPELAQIVAEIAETGAALSASTQTCVAEIVRLSGSQCDILHLSFDKPLASSPQAVRGDC